MAERTAISWAHSTFNPWIGCTKVSPGCDNCYAAGLMQDRYARVKWGVGQRRERTKTWDQPRRWNRLAAASGQPWRVFCASLADVFDNEVPNAWREDLWNLIDDTPALTWMLLTKRIGRWVEAVPLDWVFRWPKHVWMGATVVNQREAERDVPKLLEVPAPVRWLSIEPQLEEVDLSAWLFPFKPCANCPCPQPEISREGFDDCCCDPELLPSQIHWVICGGESGRGGRQLNPAWPMLLRDQCSAAGVAFHFKQWGDARPGDNGRLLDGREHLEFPMAS